MSVHNVNHGQRWFLYNPVTRMIVSRHFTKRDAKQWKRDNLIIGDFDSIDFDSTTYWE